jgi:hypothetical protein
VPKHRDTAASAAGPEAAQQDIVPIATMAASASANFLTSIRPQHPPESELRAGLSMWVGLYNARRPYTALAGRTPDEVYGSARSLPDDEPGISLTTLPGCPNDPDRGGTSYEHIMMIS